MCAAVFFGGCAREVELLHHDGGFDGAGGGEEFFSPCGGAAGGGGDDAAGTVDKLGVGGLHVDHQVAVDAAAPRTMTPVESMLSTILVAVPAFMRVEPVTASASGGGRDGDLGGDGEFRAGHATEAEGQRAEACGRGRWR